MFPAIYWSLVWLDQSVFICIPVDIWVVSGFLEVWTELLWTCLSAAGCSHVLLHIIEPKEWFYFSRNLLSSPGPTFSQHLVYLISQIYFSRQKEMFPIWVGEIINVIQAKKGTLSYQACTFEYILSFAFDMLYSYLSSQVLLRSRGPSNIFQRRKHRNWVRGKTSPSPSLMNHPRAPCPVSIGLILGLPQPYTFAAMMEKI